MPRKRHEPSSDEYSSNAEEEVKSSSSLPVSKTGSKPSTKKSAGHKAFPQSASRKVSTKKSRRREKARSSDPDNTDESTSSSSNGSLSSNGQTSSSSSGSSSSGSDVSSGSSGSSGSTDSSNKDESGSNSSSEHDERSHKRALKSRKRRTQKTGDSNSSEDEMDLESAVRIRDRPKSNTASRFEPQSRAGSKDKPDTKRFGDEIGLSTALQVSQKRKKNKKTTQADIRTSRSHTSGKKISDQKSGSLKTLRSSKPSEDEEPDISDIMNVERRQKKGPSQKSEIKTQKPASANKSVKITDNRRDRLRTERRHNSSSIGSVSKVGKDGQKRTEKKYQRETGIQETTAERSVAERAEEKRKAAIRSKRGRERITSTMGKGTGLTSRRTRKKSLSKESKMFNKELDLRTQSKKTGPLEYDDIVKTKRRYGEGGPTRLFLTYTQLAVLSQTPEFRSCVEWFFVRMKKGGNYTLCQVLGIARGNHYRLRDSADTTHFYLKVHMEKEPKYYTINDASNSAPSRKDFDSYTKRLLLNKQRPPNRREVNWLLWRSNPYPDTTALQIDKNHQAVLTKHHLDNPHKYNWHQKTLAARWELRFAETGLRWAHEDVLWEGSIEFWENEVAMAQANLDLFEEVTDKHALKPGGFSFEIMETVRRRGRELEYVHEEIRRRARELMRDGPAQNFERLEPTGNTFFDLKLGPKSSRGTEK